MPVQGDLVQMKMTCIWHGTRNFLATFFPGEVELAFRCPCYGQNGCRSHAIVPAKLIDWSY